MEKLLAWLNSMMPQFLAENTVAQYTTVVVIIVLTILLRFVICSLVYHRLAKWVGERKEEIDQKILARIKTPLGYIVFFIGLALATDVLSYGAYNEAIHRFLDGLFTTLISISVAWVAVRFVDILNIYLRKRAGQTEGKLDDQLVPLITKSLKIFVFVVAIAVILQNLGYSISGIIAGLGIGGLALALAAKDTLSNLFGSVTIFLDNPFQVGDWIKVADVEGVVESVGFRSTNIRTFYKTQVSIPNSTIANTTIDNCSRMERRRELTTLGFTYETTPEQMAQALAAIREILTSEKEKVFQEFFVVNFTGFGESSLNVLLLYYANTTDYKEFIEIREKINLRIMQEMEKIGVEFAFKSFSLYMRSGEIAQQK